MEHSTWRTHESAASVAGVAVGEASSVLGTIALAFDQIEVQASGAVVRHWQAVLAKLEAGVCVEMGGFFFQKNCSKQRMIKSRIYMEQSLGLRM